MKDFFERHDATICIFAELYLFFAPTGSIAETDTAAVRIIMAIAYGVCVFSRFVFHSAVGTLLGLAALWIIALIYYSSTGVFFGILLVLFVIFGGYWLVSKNGFSKMLDDWKNGRE